MYIDRTDDARPIVGKASKAIALPIRSLDLFAQLILFGRSILDYREKDFPSTALVGWVEPTAKPKTPSPPQTYQARKHWQVIGALDKLGS